MKNLIKLLQRYSNITLDILVPQLKNTEREVFLLLVLSFTIIKIKCNYRKRISM